MLIGRLYAILQYNAAPRIVPRHSFHRERGTKFCTSTGVSVDWGLICTWYLRLFDVAYHDIAKSRSESDCMIETLDAVFVSGRVFQRMLDAAPRTTGQATGAMQEPLPAVSKAGDEIGLITARVLRDLRKQFVFYADGIPVLLCGRSRRRSRRSCCSACRTWPP